MERPQKKFWPLVFPQRGLLALTFSTAFGLWAIVALKSRWKHQGLWIKVVKMSIVPNPTLQDAVYRSKSNIAGLFLSLVESWTWAGTLVILMEVVTKWTLCVPPLWVVIFKKTNVVNFCVLLDIQNSERDFPTSSWRPSIRVANRGRAVQAESSAHIASRFIRPIYCCWLVSCTSQFD